MSVELDPDWQFIFQHLILLIIYQIHLFDTLNAALRRNNQTFT